MRQQFLSYALCAASLLLPLASCRDGGEPAPPQGEASTDASLFTLVTRTQPFSGYALFPRADSVAAGTLNGSNAHRPLARVRLNAVALGALQNGALPQGASFPGGSVVFKEIITQGQTNLYAVMYKEPSNPLSGQGWLWAEYEPNGTVAASITSRGSGCIPCHTREQGAGNDLVRTFERQH